GVWCKRIRREGMQCLPGSAGSEEIAAPSGDTKFPERDGEHSAMLVLSRKKNESIVIDDTIIVTVVEIRGDKVRLGIQAPKEVPVHRQEVYDAIYGKDAGDAPAPVVGN